MLSKSNGRYAIELHRTRFFCHSFKSAIVEFLSYELAKGFEAQIVLSNFTSLVFSSVSSSVSSPVSSLASSLIPKSSQSVDLESILQILWNEIRSA